MKKIFMMLALASASLTGMAQTSETPQMKYSVATNSFWSNWFISADVAYDAFYSNEEKGKSWGSSPFKDFRRNLGASVAIGKWFTPGFGLRTKFSGIWGRHVISQDASTNSIKFWNVQEQALFNLNNLFAGYNETRVWNIIPYVGVGVLRNCSDNQYTHGASIGLLNTWKLTRRLAINLDLGFNVSDDDFANTSNGHKDYGTSLSKTDRYFNCEVGITYNIGKTGWAKTPDVEALKALSQSQIDALNAQLADEEAENARLKKLLTDCQNRPVETKTVTVKEVMAAPVSVFFNLNSAKIVSQKDMQNVKALADVAKEKNATIVVTGYADSKTGKENGNQTLSEKRANAVKAQLLKMGVSESNIEVVAAGGVDELNPYPYNRRAVVSLK